MQKNSHVVKIPTHAQILLRIRFAKWKMDTLDAAHSDGNDGEPYEKANSFVDCEEIDIFAHSYYFYFCRMAILLFTNRKPTTNKEPNKWETKQHYLDKCWEYRKYFAFLTSRVASEYFGVLLRHGILNIYHCILLLYFYIFTWNLTFSLPLLAVPSVYISFSSTLILLRCALRSHCFFFPLKSRLSFLIHLLIVNWISSI